MRIGEHEDGEEWTRGADSHSTVCELEGWRMLTAEKNMCVEKVHGINVTGMETMREGLLYEP